jgi:hypothetical protein
MNERVDFVCCPLSVSMSNIKESELNFHHFFLFFLLFPSFLTLVLMICSQSYNYLLFKTLSLREYVLAINNNTFWRSNVPLNRIQILVPLSSTFSQEKIVHPYFFQLLRLDLYLCFACHGTWYSLYLNMKFKFIYIYIAYFLLCCVGIHCGIYKIDIICIKYINIYYNISNISNLN